jgi:drug/metabolite transporter (DMT)-like permease
MPKRCGGWPDPSPAGVDGLQESSYVPGNPVNQDGREARRLSEQEGSVGDIKAFFLLLSSLAAVIIYMVVSPDRSPKIWSLLGVLALAVFAACLFEMRRNLGNFVQMMTLATLLGAVFSGVFWYNTRNPTSGWLTAGFGPVGFAFALWSLRFTRKLPPAA